MMCSDNGLMKYETFYKMLDLYYQFSIRLGKEIDADRLSAEREKTEETIMRYLTKDKRDYIRKCQYCGALLPLGVQSRICDACYAQMKGNRSLFARRKGSGRGRGRKEGYRKGKRRFRRKTQTQGKAEYFSGRDEEHHLGRNAKCRAGRNAEASGDRPGRGGKKEAQTQAAKKKERFFRKGTAEQ